MLLWFAVVSVVLVAIVFKSPGIDYRAVAIGAVLPVLEGLTGGPKVLHSLTGAVAVLAIAMVATRNRRLVRRRLLGIPIGVMAHLVLDGSFTDTAIFWWPFTGLAFSDGQIPEWERLGVSLLLELLAVPIAVWAYRTFGLDGEAARQRFLSEGRLDLPM